MQLSGRSSGFVTNRRRNLKVMPDSYPFFRSSWFYDGSTRLGCRSYAPFGAAGCTLSFARLHPFHCPEKGCKSCGVRQPSWVDSVFGDPALKLAAGPRLEQAAFRVADSQQPAGPSHFGKVYLDAADAQPGLPREAFNTQVERAFRRRVRGRQVRELSAALHHPRGSTPRRRS